MKILNSLTNPVLGVGGDPIVYQVGVDAEGKPILKPETTGRMLANVLARGKSEDPVRAMMIAMEIHGKAEVELEDSDFDLLEEAVKKDVQLTNLGAAVCIKALEGAKEKK